QPSKDLCFSLPSHFSSAVHRRQIESSRQRNISTCHTTLTLILRTFRAIGFGELHFHFRRPLDVGNPDIHFDSKVCCILLRHPLKIRQQGANLLGSVRKSYTSSGVFLTSNSSPNLIAITSHPLHILRGQLTRFEHVLISRAAAGVPSDGFADIFFTRLFVAGE